MHLAELIQPEILCVDGRVESDVPCERDVLFACSRLKGEFGETNPKNPNRIAFRVCLSLVATVPTASCSLHHYYELTTTKMNSNSAVVALKDIMEQAQSTAQVLSLCCLNANASVQILQAVHQCSSVATTSRSLCSTATTESRELVDLCRKTGGRLQGLQGIAITSPQIFVQVKELLDSYTEIQQQVEDCQQMKQQAAQVVQQSDRMLSRLETAVASIPPDVREDLVVDGDEDDEQRQTTDRTLDMHSKDPFVDDGDDDDEDDETTRELVGLLQNIDMDIADLENSGSSKTRGGDDLDLFSASSLGAQIFEATASKGEYCATLFSKMNDVCGSIQHVTRSTAAADAAPCCSKFQAVVGGLKGLLRCQRLVGVLNWAAKAVLRMVEAIARLIQDSWAKIQNFANQFSATKKIGKFMGKVNTAFKKGQIPSGAFSSFMKKTAGSSRGFLLQQ